jgi:anti-anti-sigma factor
MALLLEIKTGGGLVTVTGALDAAIMDSFKAQVTAWWNAHPELRRLVVDLHGVTAMDTSGLGALICVLKLVATRGGEVRLARPRPKEKLVLEITRVNKILPVFDSVEAALTAPAAGQG